MTVPETVALPGTVGEDEDSRQENVRTSAAREPNVRTTVFESTDGEDMGDLRGFLDTGKPPASNTFSQEYSACATGIGIPAAGSRGVLREDDDLDDSQRLHAPSGRRMMAVYVRPVVARILLR